MTVTAWTELVGFSCGGCQHEWSLTYDLLEASDDGVEHWRFSRGGVPTGSPYATDTCPRCPSCARPVAGRFLRRRAVEHPAPKPSAPGVAGGPIGLPAHQALGHGEMSEQTLRSILAALRLDEPEDAREASSDTSAERPGHEPPDP